MGSCGATFFLALLTEVLSCGGAKSLLPEKSSSRHRYRALHENTEYSSNLFSKTVADKVIRSVEGLVYTQWWRGCLQPEVGVRELLSEGAGVGWPGEGRRGDAEEVSLLGFGSPFTLVCLSRRVVRPGDGVRCCLPLCCCVRWPLLWKPPASLSVQLCAAETGCP